MAGPNPFENLFDPASTNNSPFGNMMGAIGSVLGVPTSQQRTGMAQGQAMSTLSEMFQQEGNAQKAFMKFLGTPQGQELFMRDPEALKTLATGLKGMQPPTPTITNVAPGSQMVQTDERGNVIRNIQNPTREEQTFNAMSEIAKLSPEQREEVARLSLLKGGDKATAKSQALDRMVKQGSITQELRDKIVGGVISRQPIRNEQGAVVGEEWTDLTTPDQRFRPGASIAPGGAPQSNRPQAQGTYVGQAPAGSPAPVDLPKTDPNEPKPLQQGDDEIRNDPVASMAIGAGAIPYVGTGISNALEQTGLWKPSASSNLMLERANSAQKLRASVASLAKIGEGMNVPAALMKELTGMASFGTIGSLNQSPNAANRQLMTLRRMVDTEVDMSELVMRDLNQPSNVRNQAGSRVQALKAVQRNMPTLPQLERVQAMIDNDTAGVWDPAYAVGLAEDMAGSAKQRAGKTVSAVTGAVGSPGGSQARDFSKMDAATLSSINPALLSQQERAAALERAQQLRAEKQKGKPAMKPAARPMAPAASSGVPRI